MGKHTKSIQKGSWGNAVNLYRKIQTFFLLPSLTCKVQMTETPKQLLMAVIYFALNAHFCTYWYYLLYLTHF